MGTLTLTTWQRRRLERQLRDTHDARVYRRTLAVLEVARGESVPAVARRLRVTPRVVYYWVEAYTRGRDPDALRDRSLSGRPGLLTREDRLRLLELLRRSPQDLGYFATEWTVPLLQEHLARYFGRHLSEDTLHRDLHRLDYAWKRPRYILNPDPEMRGKKEAHPPADQAVATEPALRKSFAFEHLQQMASQDVGPEWVRGKWDRPYRRRPYCGRSSHPLPPFHPRH